MTTGTSVNSSRRRNLQYSGGAFQNATGVAAIRIRVRTTVGVVKPTSETELRVGSITTAALADNGKMVTSPRKTAKRKRSTTAASSAPLRGPAEWGVGIAAVVNVGRRLGPGT